MNIVMQIVGILVFMLIYGAFILLAHFLVKAVAYEENQKYDAERSNESDEAVGENCDCITNCPYCNEGEFGSIL